ncbi:hypothetical protein ABB37_03752 [Leptomonas pyrrhocoris]|uniref:F-box domain-containing protein n=1 Tax=Leptomonas pyrrhocoris TaxID=157538 RepID=A0A0N0DW63_LEPPY|nr:hypothetical protein ABB37_03752 [Leptomonas pyrrhocoris]KPA81372.1 hypothetical protein ABB37_03752 [Leptomonas pyrrhocoris]|eukprot:XP_015659811.1 hypothetical protein ABB37_03752 [Leptomonas pyrrhocoris]
MECSDTLLVIASYLTKRDLVAVSGTSQLCRKVITESCITYEEKQYLVWPCMKEDYVELAPPSKILALGLVGNEQRLFVLIRTVTETSRLDEIECYLYTRLVNADGTLSEYQKELPTCFAFPTSSSRFLGNRFLVCTTREGELHVFDCLMEAMLELPVGIDGFYPSPDGESFLIDCDRNAYLCSTTSHIACWWEMRQVEPKGAASGAFHRGPHAAHASLVEARLRAQLCPLPVPIGSCHHGDSYPYNRNNARAVGGADSCLTSSASPLPPLQFCLDASSVAWRSFWVGSSSALYANEAGVFLLRPSVPRRCLEAEELPSLSTVSVSLVDSSCGDVYATPCELHDEYAIMNSREAHLHIVNYSPTRPVEMRTMDLAHILPPRVAVKGVCIAVTRRTYLVYLQHLMQDQVLLLSSDLTLTRWVSIERPSCFALWRQQATLVTASLSDSRGETSHPLVEAVEGGLGCVYTFGMRPPEASSVASADPFVSAVKITSSAQGDGGGAAGDYKLPARPRAFNGVEALSWAAFGVVSASLLWTLTALCYNGWWLHLQLLFWGKVA